MTINFVWQGVSDKRIFEHWNDGLREAMRIIEGIHEVTYCEPWDELNGDVILYWESPVTKQGENAKHYMKVMETNKPKALLFAGGMLRAEDVDGFDLLFIESKINEDECKMQEIPYQMAFGINDKVFKPQNFEKKWDGIHQGTCASWKRQQLLGEALGEKAVVCGKEQKSDPMPFDKCEEYGVRIFDEVDYETVCSLLNHTHVMVNTCDYWGGGQRATLEALACGIPVVCMQDSPKNREFVEESGAGLIVEPDANKIRDAVYQIKKWSDEDKQRGIEYVQSKFTSKHYATNLLKGIKCLMK